MKIRLTSYDPIWRQRFDEEAAILRHIFFGEEIIEVEHFGSTAVVGMKAKPVIDMLCIVKKIERIDAFHDTMTHLGYDVAGEWGIPGRRLFRKGGDARSHHIHMYEQHNEHIARHLIFRDYLQVHPHEAMHYSQLKEQLAQRFHTTAHYSKAKKAFVHDMEQRALAWFNEYSNKQ